MSDPTTTETATFATLEAKLLDPATDLMLISALAAGVEKLYDYYKSAKAGTVTPEHALAEMNALVSSLEQSHTAALAAAKAIEDARFPVTTP